MAQHTRFLTVPDSLADAIQGHAGRSVASTYRHFDLETLEKGIAAIPVPGEKCHHRVQPVMG